MDRTIELRSREICQDDFWQIIAEMSVKYAEQLGERYAARRTESFSARFRDGGAGIHIG